MPKSFLYNQSYISVNQITSKDQVMKVFKLAAKMEQKVETRQVYEPLKGYSIAVLFYQPSTRTFSSFTAAAKRLGAYVTAIHGMEEFSSVSKGESLPDTIRSIEQTTAADLIVLRHPADDSSEVAAGISTVPIINAGSGTKEHPTQALLDLYTIYQTLPQLDSLHVVMVGDLLYGRTTKSLAKLLALFNHKTKLTFVSPAVLKTPKALVTQLSKRVTVVETDDLESVLPHADVVYMTRVQKEWFEKAGKVDEYEKLKDHFVLTRHLVSKMKKEAIVLHPLPRVGEILTEVDNDHRAKYFTQMRSGLYIRMAVLQMIMGTK